MTIADFDHLPIDQKRELLLKCCGSKVWIDKMLVAPPAEDLIDLLKTAEEKWYKCSEQDWRKAFEQHPKIGDINSLKKNIQVLLPGLQVNSQRLMLHQMKYCRHLLKAMMITKKNFGIYLLFLQPENQQAKCWRYYKAVCQTILKMK